MVHLTLAARSPFTAILAHSLNAARSLSLVPLQDVNSNTNRSLSLLPLQDVRVKGLLLQHPDG